MIGQTISPYRIIEKLGGGGMGVVFKTEDTRLQVALRSLPDDIAKESQALVRPAGSRGCFCAQASHPSALIHDIGEQDGHAFIVTEFSRWRDPENYSSALPFVSGNCVVITAASKYPAAHK